MKHPASSIDARSIHCNAILEAPSSNPSSPRVHRPPTGGNGSSVARPLRMIMFGKPGAVRPPLSHTLQQPPRLTVHRLTLLKLN